MDTLIFPSNVQVVFYDHALYDNETSHRWEWQLQFKTRYFLYTILLLNLITALKRPIWLAS